MQVTDGGSMHDQFEKMDSKELVFPDTVFVHDVDSRVFQAIAVRALSEVDGVGLIEGSLFDSLLGREGHERIKGIHVEQDQKNHSLSVRLEINVDYGVCLPEKAQEIQAIVAKRITEFTGLHVAAVHVVYKDLIHKLPLEEDSIAEELTEN